MTEVMPPLTTKNNRESAADLNKKPEVWNFTALIGFALGISFAVTGLFMNFVGYFFETGNISSAMNKIATALICTAFPLALTGAHALDRISGNKRKHSVKRTAYKEVK